MAEEVNNATPRVLLQKSLGCNTVCCVLAEIFVHGMLGEFQSPRGPRDLAKMVHVEHEMHFCKVTSPPAPVRFCFPSDVAVLGCEWEFEFAAAVLCNATLHSHTHLHKAVKREAHSEPTNVIHSGGGTKGSFPHAGCG